MLQLLTCSFRSACAFKTLCEARSKRSLILPGMTSKLGARGYQFSIKPFAYISKRIPNTCCSHQPATTRPYLLDEAKNGVIMEELASNTENTWH
jgi:hypothetical protein